MEDDWRSQAPGPTMAKRGGQPGGCLAKPGGEWPKARPKALARHPTERSDLQNDQEGPSEAGRIPNGAAIRVGA